MARPPPDDAPGGATLADVAAGARMPKAAREALRRQMRPDPGPRPRRKARRPASRLLRWLGALLVLGVVGGAAGLGVVAWYLDDAGRSPREWVPYLERRASGNHAAFVAIAGKAGAYLDAVDRLERTGESAIPPQAGAAVARSGTAPAVMARLVTNGPQLAAAVAAATPGQVITLVPGTYTIEGRGLRIDRGGTPAAPIVLRAERLGDATINVDAVEAIKVSAPHWVIENLVMRGVCEGGWCEHAVHVVGAATGTVIRNSRFEDFNAQIKINGENDAWPDNGRIEGNTLVNTAPRPTRNPVTPIDLVAASNWRIVGNFIADFHREGRGTATYGAFMKGAGEGTVMERNVVLCEWKLGRSRSPVIGLSIGGGGTFPDSIKRDQGSSGTEQVRGVIRDNLIAFCNDVGIYVNKGQRAVVAHNTVLDTAGIGVRFAESTADVVGNLIDGVVQTRDGALVRVRDNETAGLLGLFVGLHPARDLFRDAARLDLRWRERPPEVTIGELRTDLCGTERMGRAMPGAFDDFAKCR